MMNDLPPPPLAARLATARDQMIYRLLDARDRLLGRSDPLIPPRRLMFDGPRDPVLFRRNGEQFLGHYIDVAGLQPDETMLDIGSGIGRKTLPLTRYLSPAGRYEGFDISQVGVEWCRTHISAAFPNFHFQRVDVFNARYNPHGELHPAAFRFPYSDASIDFAVAHSVFTHMLADEVGHYLGEAARVLRPGGRTFFSFFLLDKESFARLNDPASAFRFAHTRGRARIERPEQPEDAVAYPLDVIKAMYADAGLQIRRICWGGWSGRPNPLSFQDIVLAYRPA